MAPPSSSATTRKSAAPAKSSRDTMTPGRRFYFICYNFNNAVLWSVVLLRVLYNAAVYGFEGVQPRMGDFVMFVQSIAILEILHSAFGLIRAPLFSTLAQVSSRIFLVWFIVFPFPAVAQSPAYTSMLLAWSVTEVIRYSYFVVNIAGSDVPALTWLRFSTFYVLYPPGILSEAFLAYKAIGPAADLHQFYPLFIWAVLAIYVPMSPFMYAHMMKQRAKALKGQSGSKKTQ